MTRQPNETRVQKYQAKAENHPILAGCIFVGIAIIGLGAFVVGVQQLYEFFRPAPKPNLEVLFIDKQGPKSELNIIPSWADSGAAGLSEPVPITIGLRNRGNAPATNVKVHLVYPPAVLAFEKGSGHSVTPAVLADVLEISGDETAQSFSIGRVDRSNIMDDFEKDLYLRLRFRERLGLPVYIRRTLVIPYLSVDFAHQRAEEIGRFPIDYTVTYSESSDDEKGTIYLRIDESEMERIRALDMGPYTEMELVGKGVDPKLGEPVASEERIIPFVRGDLPLAVSIFLGRVEPAPDTFIEALVRERTSERDRWQEIYAEEEFPVIVMDRGKDGTVDDIYTNARVDDEDYWLNVRPNRPFYYVPLANFFNFKKDRSISSVVDAFTKSIGVSG